MRKSLAERLKRICYREIKRYIPLWFDEDKVLSDITTLSLGLDKKGRIAFFSKSDYDFIVAGVDFVVFIFKSLKKKFGFRVFKKDGDIIRKGEKILEVSGNTRFLFALERLCLNLLSRLSGIATETKKLSEICSKYGVYLCATRKTTPGLRYLEKYAALVGGALPHRLNLEDAILIKDNHISAFGGMKYLCEYIRRNKSRFRNVEIEVQKEDELSYALSVAEILGELTIMLDNIPQDRLPSMIERIRSFSSSKNVDIRIEISGGVRKDNIEFYAKLKPDFISVGYITLCPPIPDISADIDTDN